MATTLRDYITDLIKEAKDIKEEALDTQRMQLDDDMQPLNEIEEDIENDLIEEYMNKILKHLIG